MNNNTFLWPRRYLLQGGNNVPGGRGMGTDGIGFVSMNLARGVLYFGIQAPV